MLKYNVVSVFMSERALSALVSVDAGIVPTAKLVRREGVQFILASLWQRIPADIAEHIDGLRSGLHLPRHRDGPVSEG